MPDKMMPGPVQDAACIREAVCIHTKKIYDSCKEEDIAFLYYSHTDLSIYLHPLYSITNESINTTFY